MARPIATPICKRKDFSVPFGSDLQARKGLQKEHVHPSKENDYVSVPNVFICTPREEPNFLRNNQTNQNIRATQLKDDRISRVCRRAARQHHHSDPGPSRWSVPRAEIPELVSPETFSRTTPRNSVAIMARPSCFRIQDAYSLL
jgi:hypothetical protein